MKKLFVLLLTLTFLFTFFGCEEGVNVSDESESANNSRESEVVSDSSDVSDESAESESSEASDDSSDVESRPELFGYDLFFEQLSASCKSHLWYQIYYKNPNVNRDPTEYEVEKIKEMLDGYVLTSFRFNDKVEWVVVDDETIYILDNHCAAEVVWTQEGKDDIEISFYYGFYDEDTSAVFENICDVFSISIDDISQLNFTAEELKSLTDEQLNALSTCFSDAEALFEKDYRGYFLD